MKARLKGKVKNMWREKERVHVELEVVGTVVDGGKGPDSKAADAELKLRFKPLVADEVKFGQEFYVTVSTEKPED